VAEIIPLTTFDESTVTYYWVDGSFSGNLRDVKYKVQIGETECEATATFNVHRPEAAVTAQADQVYLDDPRYGRPGGWVHYGLGAYGPPYGVAAERIIAVPPGFSSYSGSKYFEGTRWVSLIDMMREKKLEGVWYRQKTDGFWLDETFPYAGGTEDFNDSPATRLDDFDWSEVKVSNESFRTWLMWRPDGDDTIHVPLIRVDWQWSAHALKTGDGTWQLISSSTGSPTVFDTTVHPEWTLTVLFHVRPDPPLP